jgi:hypothetical protein
VNEKQELVARLNFLMDEAAQGRSPDVTQLLGRSGPYDQAFTPLIAAWAEFSVCSSVVGTAVKLLKDTALDDATALRLAADAAGGRAKTLEVRYGMADTAGVMREVSEFVRDAQDRVQATDRARLLHEYVHFVHHLIRTKLPWHELSVAYEGAVKVKRAWSAWLGADALGGDPGAAFGTHRTDAG